MRCLHALPQFFAITILLHLGIDRSNAVTDVEWEQIDCPANGNSNGTKTCTYTNTGSVDMVIELNYQSIDPDYASLTCSIVDGGKEHVVCSFIAQTGQYDGRPCWVSKRSNNRILLVGVAFIYNQPLCVD